MADLAVLVVDDADSLHADVVESAVVDRGATVQRVNCSDLATWSLETRPGEWRMEREGKSWEVGSATSVWLRRMGSAGVAGLDSEESQLAIDELPHVLLGGLSGAGVRWVDDPFDLERAERKLIQLATARRLGVRTPVALVTNDVNGAVAMADAMEVVAKPLSPGTGIAPFVDQVAREDLALVARLPVLIQELVRDASADLRVVVVGWTAWVWRSSRPSGVVDWRAHDPGGARFSRAVDEPVASAAVDLTRALGLTMSVQDWLETPDGPVFLEANPQGAWVFLDEAASVVAPALAEHLCPGAERSATVGGRWPKPLHRVWWDLGPASKAPNRDGVEPPTVPPPEWAALAARSSEALSVAQRANDEAKSAARAAEEKASRLTQTALAAVAVATAVGGYQLGFVIDHGLLSNLTVLPVTGAIVCLALAAFEAVEIDRVGIYDHASAEDLAKAGTGDPVVGVIQREEVGRALAAWSSEKKHSSLMQARAWFSRGLVLLFLAGLISGASWGLDVGDTDDRSSTTSTSTSVPATTTTVRVPTTPSPAPTSSVATTATTAGGSTSTAGSP